MRGASILLLLLAHTITSSISTKHAPTTKGKLIARKGLLRRLRTRDDHVLTKPTFNILSNHDNMSPDTESSIDVVGIEELDLLEIMRYGEEYLKNNELKYEEAPAIPKINSSSNSENDDDDTQSAIENLIRSRSLARASRNYAEADAIKEELRLTYKVEIFDRSGEWRDEDGRYGRFGVTAKVVRKPDLKPSLSREKIQDLVDERTLLRRERNYEAADEIRDTLLSHGVELFDKLNEWETTDGSMRGLQSTDRPPIAESIAMFWR